MYYDDLAVRIGGPERSALRTTLAIAVSSSSTRFGIGAVLVEDGRASMFAEGGPCEEGEEPDQQPSLEAWLRSIEFAVDDADLRSSSLEIVTNDYRLYGTVCRFLDGDPVAEAMRGPLEEVFAMLDARGVRLSLRLKSVGTDILDREIGIAAAHDLAVFGSRGSSVALARCDVDEGFRFSVLAGATGRHSVAGIVYRVSRLDAEILSAFEVEVRRVCPTEIVDAALASIPEKAVPTVGADVYVCLRRAPAQSGISFLVVDGDRFHVGGHVASKAAHAVSSLGAKLRRIVEAKPDAPIRVRSLDAAVAAETARLLAAAGFRASPASGGGIVASARLQCAGVFAEAALMRGSFRFGGHLRSLIDEVDRIATVREEEVAIHCDASVRLDGCAAGHGIVVSQGALGAFAAVPATVPPCTDDAMSAVCEAMAAAEGIRLATRCFPGVRRVKLVSDSSPWMRCLDRICRGSDALMAHEDPALVAAARAVFALAREKGLFLDWEWTKAHTDGLDRRSLANDLADRLSLAGREGTAFASTQATKDWRGLALDWLKPVEGAMRRPIRRSTVGLAITLAEACERTGIPKKAILELARRKFVDVDYEAGTVKRDSLVRIMGEVEKVRRPRSDKGQIPRLDVVIAAERRREGYGFAVVAASHSASWLRTGTLDPFGLGDEVTGDAEALLAGFPGTRRVRFVLDRTLETDIPSALDGIAYDLASRGIAVEFASKSDPAFATGTGRSTADVADDLAARAGRSFERLRRDGDWVMLADAAERFHPPRNDVPVDGSATTLDAGALAVA